MANILIFCNVLMANKRKFCNVLIATKAMKPYYSLLRITVVPSSCQVRVPLR